MLIRVRQDRQFVTNGIFHLPRPQFDDTAAKYTKLPFMRPNENTGTDNTVPCSDPVCESPDIWLAGQAEVSNYQTALATDASYATESGNNINSSEENIIYVRGKNGSTTSKTVTVTLYYAPSGVIQSPSQWKTNVLPNDQGGSGGNIANLAPGAVGVCDATFLWTNPPTPPGGSDHYCLFAQFNDAANSNPFPNVESVFDMASLIRNNLAWGWRNTSLQPGTGATWTLSEPMGIPVDYGSTNTYQVQVTPTGGWVGWDVEFYCTRADSNGNPITLARTTIKQAGTALGLTGIVLEPGWLGQMTVNLYSPDGSQPQDGWSIPLSCWYPGTSATDIREAIHRGLVDADHFHRVKRLFPDQVGPTVLLPQGAYTGKVSNAPGVLDWFEKQGGRIPDRRY